MDAQNAVTAGEFIVEPATLHNLGFGWKISGDDNRNATVAVQYRSEGSSQPGGMVNRCYVLVIMSLSV